MATFTLILADEPFDEDDPREAPFLAIVQHGARNPASPAALAFRRCLDAIHERTDAVPAGDADGEYDLRDDLDSIAEAMEDGVEVLEELAVGQHADRFASEDLPGRLRFAARGAADQLALALQAFREVADWPRPEGCPA